MNLERAIATMRDSVVAIFRHRVVDQQKNQYEYSFGSGFAIVDNRYVATAFHILNGGQPRNPADRYTAFVVPANGSQGFHFPVVGFPLERSDVDLAVLELGACVTPGVNLPALPISFGAPVDGTHVLTMGFPAPLVLALNIDPQGNYAGGNFFLKSHANEGIIAAQYVHGTALAYEFNIGWHHGESGGPVVRLSDPMAVITVMQHYRNIEGPSGPMAGPRRGVALSIVRDDLVRLGATIV